MLRGARRFGLAALLAALPALAADEAKKDADTDKKAPPPPGKVSLSPPPAKKETKYQPVNSLRGRVRTVDPAGQSLTLEVASGIGRYARTENVDLTLAEDVKVRSAFPPVQLDEKDQPKRLTAEDKRKLRGDDPKLPGYTADLSAVAKGQIVTVQLARLKGAKKPAARGKDAEPESVFVTVLVIESQDAAPGAAKARAKDKSAPKDKSSAKDKAAAKDQ